MNKLLLIVLASLTCLGATAATAAAAGFGYASSGSFGTAGSGDGEFTEPRQMAVQSSTGHLFVADSADNRVEVFAPTPGSATYLTEFGASGPSAPTGIAVDQSSGDVYVAGSDGVLRYISDGLPTPTFTIDPAFTGTDASQVQGATELAVDPTGGDLLVAEPGQARIARYGSDGAFKSAFTGADVPDGGPLVDPISVAVDGAGVVYVVDATADPNEQGGTSRALRFAADGTYQHTYDVPTPGSIAVDPHTGYTLVSAYVAAFGGTNPRVFAFDGDTAATDLEVPGDPSNPPLTIRSVTVDGGTSANVYVLADMVYGCCGPVGVQVLRSGIKPVVTVDPPTGVTATTAHLSGTVTPPGEQTAWHFETSLDHATWTPADADADAGGGTSPVPVDGDVSGLVPNATYNARLVAATASNIAAISTEQSFTTSTIAPAVDADSTLGRITSTSASVRGMVNPNNAPTTYYVEYGADTSYGNSAPTSQDADAGNASSATPISRTLSGLQPDTTYHYRIVAHNSAGTVAGPDHSLTTRASDASSAPAGMHYELVSPADVGGTDAYPSGQSADGGRISLGAGAGQGFGGTASYWAVSNLFVASRTPAGWVTTPMNPPATPDLRRGFGWDLTPDLGTSLWSSKSLAQYHAGQEQFGLTSIDGTSRRSLPVITNLVGDTKDSVSYYATYEGASNDFSHLIMWATHDRRFLPTDSPASGDSDNRLYELVGAGTASAVLHRVDVDNSGAEIGPACGARFGSAVSGFTLKAYSTSRTISDDGSRIFFSARPGCLTEHVYARVEGEHTVDLSASECQRADCSTNSGDAFYQDASSGGSQVLFLSSEQLTDTDTDSGPDLYLYDFDKPNGHHLTQVSAGDESDATPGAGGDAQRVIQISEDGSRIYFTATDVLTTTQNSFGRSATPGDENMYLYEPSTGLTTFIATLSANDSPASSVQRFSTVSDGSGRFLVYTTFASPSPVDTDAATDVYRFDANTDELVKVSPGNTNDQASIPATGTVSAARPAGSPVADNGRVVFVTTAALQPGDTNGTTDVYLWKDGSTQMVSDGQDPGGTSSSSYSISPDGDQIAFATSRRLVPEDNDDAVSTYVARTGADVQRPPAGPKPCSQDACQGPGSLHPGAPSAQTQGATTGNAPSAGAPTFRVRALTASQRARLVKTGSVKATVTASDAGTLTITGTGEFARRRHTVISAKVTLRHGGTATLVLRLAKVARRELAATHRLTVTLRSTYSKVPVTQAARLKLTTPKARSEKASTKRRSQPLGHHAGR